MISAHGYVRRLVPPALAVALVAAIVMVPAAAWASATTWSVQPANEKGPDGRRWIEFTADPGAVVTEHLAVRNFSGTPAMFAVKAADGYLTDTGRFNMLPSNQASVDGGTWIDVRDGVTVGPRQTVVIPFTITVPDDATPGDHPAGIAASVMSTDGTVDVESRVGFRVMMRVTGELDPRLTIADVGTGYRPIWNPFRGGEVTVSYDIANEGNVRLAGQGDVKVAGPLGSASRSVAVPAVDEILAGGSRRVTTTVSGVWPLGRVTTDITVKPAAVGDDTIDEPLGPITVTVTTWAMPWPQLVLVAVVFLVVFGVRYLRRHRRRRLDQLLARARAEGRRESAVSGGAPSSSG